MDAKGVAEELAAAARQAGGKSKIAVMRIEIGELATISIQALAREIASLLPGTSVDISEKKAKVQCECGFCGRPQIGMRMESGEPDFSCPRCKKKYPQATEGDSVELKDIGLE